MSLNTYTIQPMVLQVLTSYTLPVLRYSQNKILKVKVTTARSKLKSRSHHDAAHLHPQPMSPTKYEHPLQLSQCSSGKNFKLKVTMTRSNVKSRSHNDIAHLHPTPPLPQPLTLLWPLFEAILR